MSDASPRGGLFAAQLKYWRRKRGLSQLDFSIAADVSARHISFLETGRAKPSEKMVLRLAQVLGLPLRERNTLLVAAGFGPAYPEPKQLPPLIQGVLDQTLRRMEPCPVVVVDRRYDLLQANHAASTLFALAFADPSALTQPPNLLHALFNPRLARPFVREWETLARAMLVRLHEHALLSGDAAIRELIDDMLAYPDVPKDWHEPDFAANSDPVQLMRLALPGDIELAFTTTLTRFGESRHVSLDELVIETFLPADEATDCFCSQHLST